MTDLKQHPLSAAFPKMTDETFAELRADIAANGLHSPITLFDEQVLDGWHRQRACQQTGVEPRFEAFSGDWRAAIGFVVSANIARRHLTPGERADAAAAIANIKQGGDRRTDQSRTSDSGQVSLQEAADLFGVDRATVADAKAVAESGDEDLKAQVKAGKMSRRKAAKQARAAKPKPANKSKPQRQTIAPAFEIAPRTVAEWNALSAPAQRAHLMHRDPKAALNQQKLGEDDNLIDWAKWTWNPITGCLHTCPYCYARDIAERFAGTPGFPNGFAPTLRADRLSAPLNGRPRVSDDPRDRRIFTGSMSDVFGRWVPGEWIEAVLSVVREAPAWDFLMLTKFPKRMSEFAIPDNVWMGTSVDCQARVAGAEAAFAKVKAKVKWLSVEPMIEPLQFKHLDRFDLLVIGGASPSTKTPHWIPPYSWLDDLMGQADKAKCPVFLKSNLYRKEQPGGTRYTFSDHAPEVFHYLSRASAPNELVNAA